MLCIADRLKPILFQEEDMSLVAVSDQELMDVDGGFVFTAAGIVAGAYLGKALAVKLAVKGLAVAGAATMGATGGAIDVAVATQVIRGRRGRR